MKVRYRGKMLLCMTCSVVLVFAACRGKKVDSSKGERARAEQISTTKQVERTTEEDATTQIEKKIEEDTAKQAEKKIEEDTSSPELQTTQISEQENRLGNGETRFAKAGKLQGNGNQRVDESGNPAVLRGISTHGIAWFPDYINQECLNDWSNFGANVVRFAMYTSEYGGYCSGGDRENLKNLIINGVNCAKNADMYAIVDWHILSDGNPQTYQEDAKAFFSEMSAKLAGYDNVIYEICNEPNGGTSWQEVKAYAQEVIPVIRANAPDSIIIVGTPTWSQEVEQALANPVTGYDNIMYSLHFYAATHKDDLRNKMISAHNQGLPIFVSEYGLCDSSGNGAIDREQSQLWFQAMNENQISYVAWNLSNKDETSSLIASSCDKKSGFTYEDLSEEGKMVHDMLLN